jgi:hypothetical protein
VYAERYFKLLNTVLEPYVDELPLAVRCLVYFRQDGASLHFAGEVRYWLDEVIHWRWIGRRGQIEWPQKFPDLKPLDIFLLGQLKSLVYCTRPRTIDNLKGNICVVFKDSTPLTFDRVSCSVPFCKSLCKKSRGTNLNICFSNVFYETELQGHSVCEITRCSVRFWNCIL